MFLLLLALGGGLIALPHPASAQECEPPPDIIPASDIEAVVASEMTLLDETYLRIDDLDQPITFVAPDLEGFLGMDQALYLGFADGIVILGFNFTEMAFSEAALLVYGEFSEDDLNIERQFVGDLDIVLEGCTSLLSGEFNATEGDEAVVVEIAINQALIGAGSSRLELKDGRAYLTGELGTRTYQQIADLIETRPDIDTLVLANVPGSMNDSVNMHTGRLIRAAGYSTYVLADGFIASGGVDLFVAGVKRVIEEGAQVGVHSWCCVDGEQAVSSLPRDHPAHAAQLAYFEEMMGASGPDFYFFTLEAADFDDIYFMSTEDLIAWKIAEIVEPGDLAD